jgi:hypothetical protein
MAAKAEVMKHFLHVGGDILRVFMAVVTGAAAAIVDKIVVALDTLGRLVIGMVEGHWNQGFIGSILIAIALGN